MSDTAVVVTASPTLPECHDVFIEVLSSRNDEQQQQQQQQAEGEDTPRFVQAYVAQNVPPRECGTLVKRLGKLTVCKEHATTTTRCNLSHLRRVRRRRQPQQPEGCCTGDMESSLTDMQQQQQQQQQEKANDTKEDSTLPLSEKSQQKVASSQQTKTLVELDVVLGSVEDVHRTALDRDMNAVEYLQQTYQLWTTTSAAIRVAIATVPARMAKSETERNEFNAYWPTVFYSNQTPEAVRQARRLSNAEVIQMQQGLRAALQHGGAVIMNPTTGQVLSQAQRERAAQQQTVLPVVVNDRPWSLTMAACNNNPLASPIMYAIQGMSRQERETARQMGMNSATFHNGQYLCTGLDCYAVVEPTVWEAMSLVHARVRRVVFGTPSSSSSSCFVLATKKQQGGLLDYFVHNLPDTNHSYRAFYCRPDSELGQLCRHQTSTATKGNEPS